MPQQRSKVLQSSQSVGRMTRKDDTPQSKRLNCMFGHQESCGSTLQVKSIAGQTHRDMIALEVLEYEEDLHEMHRES